MSTKCCDSPLDQLLEHISIIQNSVSLQNSIGICINKVNIRNSSTLKEKIMPKDFVFVAPK